MCGRLQQIDEEQHLPIPLEAGGRPRAAATAAAAAPRLDDIEALFFFFPLFLLPLLERGTCQSVLRHVSSLVRWSRVSFCRRYWDEGGQGATGGAQEQEGRVGGKAVLFHTERLEM